MDLERRQKGEKVKKRGRDRGCGKSRQLQGCRITFNLIIIIYHLQSYIIIFNISTVAAAKNSIILNFLNFT